jgi:hypothetical protein
MSENEKSIFEDIELCGAMKNTQITPYVFVSKAYNAMRLNDFTTAKLWIEHADRFKNYFDDNPREAENFVFVLRMAVDLLMIQREPFRVFNYVDDKK